MLLFKNTVPLLYPACSNKFQIYSIYSNSSIIPEILLFSVFHFMKLKSLVSIYYDEILKWKNIVYQEGCPLRLKYLIIESRNY